MDITSAKDARQSIEKVKEEKTKKIAETENSEHEEWLRKTAILREEWEANREKREKEEEAARKRALEEERRIVLEKIRKYKEEQKNMPPKEERIRAEKRAWFEKEVKDAIKYGRNSFTYSIWSDRFQSVDSWDSMDLIIDEVKAAGYIVKKEFIQHHGDPEDFAYGITRELLYTFIIPE